MKAIRIGNDIKVRWSVFATDENGTTAPYLLEGKDVTVWLICPFERRRLTDYKVSGNVITWSFLGKNQQQSGRYSFMLVENDGKANMRTVDAVHAFALYHVVEPEDCEENDAVKIETVTLSSSVGVSYIGSVEGGGTCRCFPKDMNSDFNNDF